MRVLEDGDFVFAHAEYDFFDPKIGLDVFRFEGGRTHANKQLVRAFVDDILVHGRMDRLAGYCDGDAHLQHNPGVADGLSGLGAALAAMEKAGRITEHRDTIETIPPRHDWKNGNGKFGF